jgi:hypothetical protein
MIGQEPSQYTMMLISGGSSGLGHILMVRDLKQTPFWNQIRGQYPAPGSFSPTAARYQSLLFGANDDPDGNASLVGDIGATHDSDADDLLDLYETNSSASTLSKVHSSQNISKSIKSNADTGEETDPIAHPSPKEQESPNTPHLPLSPRAYLVYPPRDPAFKTIWQMTHTPGTPIPEKNTAKGLGPRPTREAERAACQNAARKEDAAIQAIMADLNAQSSHHPAQQTDTATGTKHPSTQHTVTMHQPMRLEAPMGSVTEDPLQQETTIDLATPIEQTQPDLNTNPADNSKGDSQATQIMSNKSEGDSIKHLQNNPGKGSKALKKAYNKSFKANKTYDRCKHNTTQAQAREAKALLARDAAEDAYQAALEQEACKELKEDQGTNQKKRKTATSTMASTKAESPTPEPDKDSDFQQLKQRRQRITPKDKADSENNSNSPNSSETELRQFRERWGPTGDLEYYQHRLREHLKKHPKEHDVALQEWLIANADYLHNEGASYYPHRPWAADAQDGLIYFRFEHERQLIWNDYNNAGGEIKAEIERQKNKVFLGQHTIKSTKKKKQQK